MSQIKIAVITYDNPHRKTQDILTKLIIRGYSNLTLVVLPWKQRDNFRPLYNHRPSNCESIGTEELCRNLSIAFCRKESGELFSFFNEENFKYILIAGAGLLPDELVLNHKIINSHPGYLPFSKGLDALKWAIYNETPIGATVHFISCSTDEGILISQEMISVYFTDSFYSVASRLYELEIRLIVDAIEILETKASLNTSLENPNYLPTRRMPHHLELAMMAKFELRRLKSNTHNINNK